MDGFPPAPLKRERSIDDNVSSPAKKIKTLPEEPSVYSDNVRKKLAATSRTGQACDRCKERKMKCDPDPVACQPCRQKQLRCYTTDRVSGQSRERGQTGRDENEITYLRDQLAAYRRLYGPLNDSQMTSPSTHNRPPLSAPSPPPLPSRLDTQPPNSSTNSPVPQYNIPSSKYTGWSVDSVTETLHTGPVDYTEVDLISFGSINTAGFACDIMHDYPVTELNHFNFSNNSIANTMSHKQLIQTLELPPREEVLKDINNFFWVMWGFVPVVHKQTLLKVVDRLFDDPFSVSIAEKLQVVMILAIMAHQDALRNHSNSVQKLERSFHYLHYSLGFYTHLIGERSLPSLQALTLILVQVRNFPKPGFSWLLANQLIVFAINLDYHRDPDKIRLPPEEGNDLAKELRKRIFHVILGIAVTTGCRFGKPSAWHFSQWDVPLPTPLLDDEISVSGTIGPRSGRCDYWPCLHLSKFMPLMIELYNHVLSRRNSASVYLKIVDALRTKVEAWRAEWDEYPRDPDPESDVHRYIHGLLFDSWAAEFLLNLHHPRVNTSPSPDVQHEHLNNAHRAATRLLRNFHILSERYKAVDFTWHSIVAYVCGFGVALQTYKERAGVVSDQERQKIRNELAGWISLIQTADHVLRTEKYLERSLKPLAKAVEDLYEQYTAGPPTRSASISQQNGIPHNAKPMKKEPSVDMSPYSRTTSVSQNDTPYAQQNISQQSPRFQTQTSYVLPQTTVPPAPYIAYSRTTSTVPYTNLPTSLAPLLNDTMAGTYSHMQQPVTPVTPISLSTDIAMSFHPQLYSSENVTMVWPHTGGATQ